MDIKERELKRLIGLLDAWGYKYAIKMEDGFVINGGLDINPESKRRRKYYDEFDFPAKIKSMNVGDVLTIDIAGKEKFTLNGVRAQLSGVGIKIWGKKNFTVHAEGTVIEGMRTA